MNTARICPQGHTIGSSGSSLPQKLGLLLPRDICPVVPSPVWFEIAMASSQFSPSLVTMSSGDDTKPYACTICVQRKVKCDKRQPCLSCLKSRLQCEYRSVPPSQRRKRKTDNPNPAVLDVLRSHEAALRRAGIPFESFDDRNEGGDDHDEGTSETIENHRGRSHPAATVSSNIPRGTPRPRRGILISEHGGRRYYEHGLLGSLGKEVRIFTQDSASSSFARVRKEFR